MNIRLALDSNVTAAKWFYFHMGQIVLTDLKLKILVEKLLDAFNRFDAIPRGNLRKIK